MNRNWLITGIVVIIVVVIALFAYPRLTASAASTANLQTAPVQRGDLIASVNAAGNVVATQDTKLGFQTSGRVAQVSVQVGDRVTQGQVLMQLDTTDLDLALRSAQDNLANAQANYDAAKAKAATNPDQLTSAKAALDKAASAL